MWCQEVAQRDVRIRLHLAAGMSVARIVLQRIEMLSRLNAGMKSAETQGTDTVQPRHLGKALLL